MGDGVVKIMPGGIRNDMVCYSQGNQVVGGETCAWYQPQQGGCCGVPGVMVSATLW